MFVNYCQQQKILTIRICMQLLLTFGHFEPRTEMFVITRIRESDVLLGPRHNGYETVCVCWSIDVDPLSSSH